MKRLISICIVCLLMVGLFTALPVSAAAGLSLNASSTTVTVGQNVTLTLKYDGDGQTIGGVIGNLTYDTSVFSYVSFSGTDVQVNGGAGKMRFIYTPSTPQAPTSVTISFTFKSDAPGSCNFAVATEEFVNDTDYSSLGAPSGSVTVTASNPTLSGNANLTSLKPSKGTLTPKFDPNVTEYKISVGYDVTSLSLSVTTDHSDAKTYISGKNALVVGKNTRTITVTAPNGTTKKYTVVITRAAAPSTTTGTNPPTTGTTLPQPADDALEVVVDGKAMTILDTQASVNLPTGFKWSNLTINRVEVPAAVNAETGMTLLYLVSEDKADDGFYIYDQHTDAFTRFCSLQVTGGTYLLYPLPEGNAPAGTIKDTLAYDGGEVGTYRYKDEALSDFYILWAAPAGGETGWYTYDKKEGTMQRYHATAQVEGDTTPQPDKDVVTDPKKDENAFSLGEFFQNNQKILLIGVIAIAGVVVVILLFVLLSAGGRKKGKH